jgi:hypothetical protein
MLVRALLISQINIQVLFLTGLLLQSASADVGGRGHFVHEAQFSSHTRHHSKLGLRNCQVSFFELNKTKTALLYFAISQSLNLSYKKGRD